MSSLAQCHKTSLSPAAQAAARIMLGLARVSDTVTRAMGFFERAAAGRRALRDLASADDRMLKDIGLDRADLRNAASEPFYRDPTALLAGRVREGRTHRPRRLGPRRQTMSRYY